MKRYAIIVDTDEDKINRIKDCIKKIIRGDIYEEQHWDVFYRAGFLWNGEEDEYLKKWFASWLETMVRTFHITKTEIEMFIQNNIFHIKLMESISYFPVELEKNIQVRFHRFCEKQAPRHRRTTGAIESRIRQRWFGK